MRSFFKKPAWAANAGDTGTEFYRRSEQTYGDIVAANREAHKKFKIAPETPDDPTDEAGRLSKRPRLSNDAEKKERDPVDTDQPVQGNELRGHRRLSTPLSNHPIQLERTKSEEEDETSGTTSAGFADSYAVDSPVIPSPRNLVPPNSLARRLSSQPKDPRGSNAAPKDSVHHPNAATIPQNAQPSTSPVDDPIVQILITSQIPSTSSLMVPWKMSQGLREVRIQWCQRQGFTTETQSSVYLTWRGRRLFDVTTCRSLGIKLQNNPFLSDMDDDIVAGQREHRIHMEAVTENPLLLNRPGSPQDRSKTSPDSPSPEDDQNEPMKLILRSPGLDDFRIKARPKTLVSKLISAFRDKQNIPVDNDVSLLLDGDRLHPNTCLRDHDIEDLDMVDVQIKQRS